MTSSPEGSVAAITPRVAAAEFGHASPVLEARNVVKWFGGVQALSGVSLAVRPGEVVGLVGDNGAGKSTIVKILSGLISPDEGEVLVDGIPVKLTSADARLLGIQTVHQGLALCDNLDAAANVHLGHEPVRFAIGPLKFLNKSRAVREAEEHLQWVGARIPDVRSSVGGLSGGQRQAVAIARSTMDARKVIMLDEPTAALGVGQRAATLDLIRTLASRGLAVIVISHNLEDVFRVSDRVIGLRLGQVTLDSPIGETTHEEVVSCMTTGPQVRLPMEES